MDLQSSQTTQKSRPPLIFVLLVIALIAIFIFGLKWIFGLGQGEVGSVPFLVFDYTVGLTMIFLPCTLPLAFVIVPMVMGKSYQKGIGMVLAFGLGVTITLSIYGALIGLLGQVLGVNQVETAKNILYALAGLMAILFALGELGLIKFKSPTYAGGVPQFIMKQRDIAKAGLLGLFMGNVGVGCPNPLFNAVIIPQIVATGSPFQGFIIMVVQALGRITPLFILAFLAILGINATSFLVRHKDKVTKITAWATLYVGGFLLTLGLFGHDWWVLSGIHTLGEKITQENAITTLLGSKVAEFGHTHAAPVGGASWLFGLPVSLGTPVLILAWILPMLWYLLKRERGVSALPVEQQANEKRYLSLLTWFFISIFIFIFTVFGYLLPHNFTAHWSKEAMMHEEEEMDDHDDSKMGMTNNVSDFHATLSSSPSAILAGKPFVLHIALHDSKGNPINDLQVSHERILHVILVSEDLEEFIHVHPEDSEIPAFSVVESGQFNIPLALSKAGRYRVLVDGNRLGNEVSATSWLSVGGKASNTLIEKNLSQEKTFDRYDVILSVEPKTPKTGEEVHLNYRIERNGKQISDTDKFLGADMHLLIASLDLSVMSHTHGLKVNAQDNPLGEIDAHYSFPYPGIWKIFGQFQHQGRVVTTDFMVEVELGTTSAQIMAPHVDDH
ncbi:MAG: hypothetical protein A3E40_04305 [Candidatus Levybacteria bacterium RIFCSPHIGHO2_12_FULL_37_9]|nr:MAG: hypothetical protein A3E40_04305 [Candidatus Levybacteria bacterium RIFCSPHIGHO2_12_FULL_37_9]